MKKIAVLAGWVIFLFPLSLLTVSLATAKTTLNNPDLWAEPAPAAPLEAASVAPDAFGYTYQDEIETNGPTFGFIDISGSGNLFIFADDDDLQNIPSASLIGFDFEFYGLPLSDLR
ncbi:MAG TPA: hypothetical protein VEC93_16200, partial [Anaerolineae bacterium]|nr:hypothetical protein [Anaerolineae bacterium]